MSFPVNYRDPIVALAMLGGPIPARGAMVIGGWRVPVAGTVVYTWADGDACAPEATDRTVRRVPPRFIVLHTTEGQPHDPPVSADVPLRSRACSLARYQSTTDRDVSWDFLNTAYGAVIQQNDPLRWYSWQAGQVNGFSLGVETEQGPGGTIYAPSLRSIVYLADALTRSLQIPRQLPAVVVNGRRVPDRRVLDRFLPAAGSGESWRGLCGHRNTTPQRGPGDPGDAIMEALMLAGYEGFDVQAGEDLYVWSRRQAALGVPATGIPGPETFAALSRRGFPSGQWVWRPGD